MAEIENFSGKSKLTIEQDFYATVLTCNVAQMLMQEVQDEINEVLDQKKLKYKYKVNRNIGKPFVWFDRLTTNGLINQLEMVSIS